MTANVIDRGVFVEFCTPWIALRLARDVEHRTVPPPAWITWWCRGRRPLTQRRRVQATLIATLGREKAVSFCEHFQGLRIPSASRVAVLAQRLMARESKYCDEIELRLRLERLVAPTMGTKPRGFRRLVRRRLAEAGRGRRPRGRALSLLRARAKEESPSVRPSSRCPSISVIRF
jgi:hypothetical protein